MCLHNYMCEIFDGLHLSSKSLLIRFISEQLLLSQNMHSKITQYDLLKFLHFFFNFQAYILKNILFVEETQAPDNWRQLTGWLSVMLNAKFCLSDSGYSVLFTQLY